jgi:hypothetical protein
LLQQAKSIETFADTAAKTWLMAPNETLRLADVLLDAEVYLRQTLGGDAA